ncbi:curli assembly protein CsgF [Aureimonas sp. AU40]|uniref:curli assembly protein CsgF n=1 Tax=Aureimonas sp. AU40 TaxID=1637747 RepID=UPI0009E7155D|nr:curli assembly protein CsgF [Aureimonas sp. AU40]
MSVNSLRTLAFLSIASLSIGSAAAGDLVYTPINPSFGGSPLNSAHLLSIAGAQKNATASDYKKPVDSTSAGTTGSGTKTQSDADLFVRQLQGRLLSALASQVTDAIFGENPQDSGTVQFGDTKVTFDRTLTTIRLRIENATDGTVTDIVVPQLVTSKPATTTASTASSSASASQLSTATPVLSGSALTPLSIN